jgi:molybdenum cofactor sulfurtransferase
MGPLGSRSEDIVASCRLKVLQHFGADPSDYDVVFTSGSTSALKLVAECFPWSPTSSLVYPYNSHTSVLGMREFAPSAYCVPSALFHRSSTSPSSTKIDTNANQEEEESNRNTFYSLLVVPGECNFSGKHFACIVTSFPLC